MKDTGQNMEKTNHRIPFNWPHMTGKELTYIAEAQFKGGLAGDGSFTKCCHDWLEEQTGCKKGLLTHSCTAALEMTALLLDIKPGDEVIMPSYTFVSTANAFVLRGAVPVFVDIRPDTQNIDESLIEAAITEKTKAICVVHYAGVACEMESILQLADVHELFVIEDAAQGIKATYKGLALGSIGHMGTFSFHETKNIHCGEGGALLLRDDGFVSRAEIIREKGTNRSQFFRGEVDKYTWRDIGSSFLLNDLSAAFLLGQLEEVDKVTEARLSIWNAYHQAFEGLENTGLVQRPFIPVDCQHNAHIYYLILTSNQDRSAVLKNLKTFGVHAVSHYEPLHSSPAGKKYARAHGGMKNTDYTSSNIIRLPIWFGMGESQVSHVIQSVSTALHM